VRRGEVWWAELSEPWGRRPVVLLSRHDAYTLLSWVVVAPLTTYVRDIKTFVGLDPSADGVPRRCAVNLDAIQAIRPEWIDARIVQLRPEKIQAIDHAIHFALGLRSCP
jgi:mRNA interferase MazF